MAYPKVARRRPLRDPTTTPASTSPYLSVSCTGDASWAWAWERSKQIRHPSKSKEDEVAAACDEVNDLPKASSRMSAKGRSLGEEARYAVRVRPSSYGIGSNMRREFVLDRSPNFRNSTSEKVNNFRARARKDKNVARSRSRGYFVLDLRPLEARRMFLKRDRSRNGAYPRAIPQRSQQGRRWIFSKRGMTRALSLDPMDRPNHSPRAFSFLTLDEYLQERTRLRSKVQELDSDRGMPRNCSRAELALTPKDSSKPRAQKLKRTRTPLLGVSLQRPIQELRMSQTNVREHPSAVNFEISQARIAPPLRSQSPREAFVSRHGCGVPWSCHRAQKYKGKMFVDRGVGRSFSCGFPVSRRRYSRKKVLKCRSRPFKSCKNRVGRFISHSDSGSETAPLLTESEIHQGKSDVAGGLPPSGDRMLGGRLDFRGFDISAKGEPSLLLDEGKGYVCKATRLVDHGSEVTHRSLSQKYRPKSFQDMVGQNLVAQALSNAILRQKIAPVYLFQGSRGTGKTSAARIFATALNCLSIEQLRPCGLCRECEASSSGKSFDIREVDAAGNSGIDSMKALLRFVGLPPQSSSRYKVFIIDECHMLTKQAWNLFLKIMEEPPTYVVFVLITINPDQLPRTVVSRCQKFPFSKIKDADILARLQKLAQQEKVDIEREALELITARSDGSLRDAETTLDQLSILEQKITTSMVRELVGLIADDKLLELLESALSTDTVKTVRCIRELMEAGVEPLALMSQLATLITDILAGNLSAKAKGENSVFCGHYLSKNELEKLRQALKILSEAEKQLRTCNDRSTWLTAALLQFSPVDSCLLPTSSLGTSVTQSPIAFQDTSEKETNEWDRGTIRPPWEDEEKWENSQLQLTTVEEMTSARNNSSVDCSGVESLVSSVNGSFAAHNSYCFNQSHALPTSTREMKIGDGLQATSFEYSGDVSEVAHREANATSPCTMEELWQKVFEGSRSSILRQVFCGQGKLVSLSVSEAFAIAHLEFRSLEDKVWAEKAKTSISNAFQVALGCPVEVKLSISPSQGEAKESDHHTVALDGLTDFKMQAKPSLKSECKLRCVKFERGCERPFNSSELQGNIHASKHGFENKRSNQEGLSSDDSYSWINPDLLNERNGNFDKQRCLETSLPHHSSKIYMMKKFARCSQRGVFSWWIESYCS